MCGIVGYKGQGNEALLRTMTDQLEHRGPDGEGFWQYPGSDVGFGHRRLAILDLSSAGAQPMPSSDGTVTLCYNGELYDYLHHRKQLEARGYHFKSDSDTEVMLNLYHCYGIAFLQQVNGIFAAAIWDQRVQELYLVRDQMGVKPLYYQQRGETLYFASEIRAILGTSATKPTLNNEALATFLQFLYVPGSLTLFDGIKKVPPGCYALYKRGQLNIKRWYQPKQDIDNSISESEWIERLSAEFDAAVQRQMVADVKVGAFLSGGLDSSAIVATALKHMDAKNLQCFTIAYPEKDLAREGIGNDLPYARELAKNLHIDLHETLVTPNVIDLLPKIVSTVEEPDADMTALVTLLISESAQAAGATVLLSGTGGDEVFHGYRTHQAYRHFRLLDGPLKKTCASALQLASWTATRTLGAASPAARRSRRYAEALSLSGVQRHLAIVNNSGLSGFPQLLNADINAQHRQYLPDLMEGYASVQGPIRNEASLHSWLLTQTFLADHNFLYADKCGMAHSLEIRVPFMDKNLMELADKIPPSLHTKGGVTKHLLKQCMSNTLPENIINRPKVGFNPPIRTWVTNSNNPMTAELLSEKVVNERGIFNAETLSSLVKHNSSGATDASQMLYAAQYLELWCREYLDA